MRHETIYLTEHFPQLKGDGCEPKLEIYLPEAMVDMGWGDKKKPCVFICPGGGYHGVSRREAEPIALKFLEQGYNVFVLTYSVRPHRFPQQLREVAAAMELIHANADEWLCDVEKVAIVGFSAGGHLAAHYSTCYDIPEVREVFPESKCVNASVLCYPVISADFSKTHQGSFFNLLGHKPDKDEEKYFSCERNVKETTPPAFIWHTAEDGCVPVANSLIYAKALTDNKVPVELHIYPFGGHGLSTCDEQTCDNMNEIIAYNNVWIDSMKNWLKLIFK